MKRKKFAVGAFLIFVLATVLGSALCASAEDAKAKYPSMASLDQYLMDRDAEIAMARSAAPVSIARDAEVVILGRHGYETAVKGKNGFVCDVERSWMGPFDKNTEFWNPERVGGTTAGANKVSGNWRPVKTNISEDVITVACKVTRNVLSMSDPTGDSFTAKFDGKEFPFKGNPESRAFV